MKTNLFFVILFMYSSMTFAQNSMEMDSTIKAHTDVIKTLKKVQVGGYIQPQFQWAESKGAEYIGGKFADSVDNRFIIRRGRLRVYYHSNPFEVELITDNTEKGISLHDLSVAYTFEKIGIKYTAGLFKRPFGFEQLYSSSAHEAPERARFTSLLLPSEADLGFKLSYLNCKPFLIEAGVFNGNTTATDVDSYKDIIARISIDKKLSSSNISGGISFYHGSLIQGSKNLFETKTVNGLKQFILQDTLVNTKGSSALRQYLGADVQYSFKLPIGKTTLRAEFISGTQPGSSKTTESPKSATAPNFDTYLRKFTGFSSFFLQNIGSTNLQFVAKYDWYDPNSDAAETDFGMGTNLNPTDLKYSTLGLGLNYYYHNMYLMVYYDIVSNEKAPSEDVVNPATGQVTKKALNPNFNGFENDLKDNVLTIRTQFKF